MAKTFGYDPGRAQKGFASMEEAKAFVEGFEPWDIFVGSTPVEFDREIHPLPPRPALSRYARSTRNPHLREVEMPLFTDGEFRVYKTSCGPFDNNAYLLVCLSTSESIIIDAPAEPAEVLEEAKDTSVQAILITHNHGDHLAGLEEMVAATGAMVYAHAADADRLPCPPDGSSRTGTW